MTGYGVRIGVGTRFSYDGEVVEIIEVLTTPAGNEVLLKGVHDKRIRRMALRELLNADNARVIPEGPGPAADDDRKSRESYWPNFLTWSGLKRQHVRSTSEKC